MSIRKLREVAEAQRELVAQLDDWHRITMTSKGRDPEKYSSTFSRLRDEANAILRAMEGRDE